MTTFSPHYSMEMFAFKNEAYFQAGTVTNI